MTLLCDNNWCLTGWAVLASSTLSLLNISPLSSLSFIDDITRHISVLLYLSKLFTYTLHCLKREGKIGASHTLLWHCLSCTDTGRTFVAFTASAIPFYCCSSSGISIWHSIGCLCLLLLGTGHPVGSIGLGIFRLADPGFCFSDFHLWERKRDWKWVYLLLISILANCLLFVYLMCALLCLCTWSIWIFISTSVVLPTHWL